MGAGITNYIKHRLIKVLIAQCVKWVEKKEKADNIWKSARTLHNTNINDAIIKVAQTIHLKICGRHELERTEIVRAHMSRLHQEWRNIVVLGNNIHCGKVIEVRWSDLALVNKKGKLTYDWCCHSTRCQVTWERDKVRLHDKEIERLKNNMIWTDRLVEFGQW